MLLASSFGELFYAHRLERPEERARVGKKILIGGVHRDEPPVALRAFLIPSQVSNGIVELRQAAKRKVAKEAPPIAQSTPSFESESEPIRQARAELRSAPNVEWIRPHIREARAVRKPMNPSIPAMNMASRQG